MNLIFYIITISLVLICDILTKQIVISKIKPLGTFPVIERIFHFTYLENKGAAFGIMQNARLFFIVSTIIIIAIVVRFIMRNKPENSVLRVGIALILGGAIGNFIDRLRFGFVVDFIDLRFINFAIFNIADFAVVLGAALLCIYYVFIEKRQYENHEIV